MNKMDKDGSGDIDFDEFLSVLKEEDMKEEDDTDEKPGLGLLFGKEGVLRSLVVKKEKVSALDLKKIANMNPNRHVVKVINKKESLHKIANMFKGLAQTTNKKLLDSDSDDQESEEDEELLKF